MTLAADGTHALVFERQLAHSPQKVWRALTDPALIKAWLMQNDFAAKVGHRFTVRAKPLPGWTGVTHCEVVALEPPRLLSYRWGDGTESISGLRTLVTWTLTPSDGGTLLRLEQSGFRPQDTLANARMGQGWPRILDRLASVAGETA